MSSNAPAAAGKDTAEGMEGVEQGPGAPASAPTPAPVAALPPAAPLFKDAALDRLIKLASSGDVPQVVSEGPGAPAEGGRAQARRQRSRGIALARAWTSPTCGTGPRRRVTTSKVCATPPTKSLRPETYTSDTLC